MIALSFKLDQISLKVGAYIGKNSPQLIEYFSGKDLPSIFCHKDQVNMHQENTRSSSS